MDRATKRQRTEVAAPTQSPSSVGVQTQLKPSQVKTTSNIFGDLPSDDDEADDDDEDDDECSLADDDDEAEEDDEVDEIDEQSEDDDDDDDEARDTEAPRKAEAETAAFSLALDKILGRDLPSAARRDPVLARSLASRQVRAEKLDARLERKVRQQMTAEKKAKLDKGHDDLARFHIGSAAALDDEDDEDDEALAADRARTLDRERQMRKVAQRGCVRLFNAVRAAQTEVQQKVDEGALKRKARRDEVLAAREEVAQAVKKEEPAPMAQPNLFDMILAGGQ